MRNVVAYTIVSVDGVAEAPETFLTEWDDELDANLGEVIGRQDAVLLGREMYDEWSVYWPPSDMQPFADFINRVQKYVATSSELSREWGDSEAIEGDVATFVRELKRGDGGDIGVHGSIALTQSLLREGVVDELHLVVAPAVVGKGRRLFTEDMAYELEPLSSERTPVGALLLHYRVGSSDSSAT